MRSTGGHVHRPPWRPVPKILKILLLMVVVVVVGCSAQQQQPQVKQCKRRTTPAVFDQLIGKTRIVYRITEVPNTVDCLEVLIAHDGTKGGIVYNYRQGLNDVERRGTINRNPDGQVRFRLDNDESFVHVERRPSRVLVFYMCHPSGKIETLIGYADGQQLFREADAEAKLLAQYPNKFRVKHNQCKAPPTTTGPTFPTRPPTPKPTRPPPTPTWHPPPTTWHPPPPPTTWHPPPPPPTWHPPTPPPTWPPPPPTWPPPPPTWPTPPPTWPTPTWPPTTQSTTTAKSRKTEKWRFDDLDFGVGRTAPPPKDKDEPPK